MKTIHPSITCVSFPLLYVLALHLVHLIACINLLPRTLIALPKWIGVAQDKGNGDSGNEIVPAPVVNGQ